MRSYIAPKLPKPRFGIRKLNFFVSRIKFRKECFLLREKKMLGKKLQLAEKNFFEEAYVYISLNERKI